MKIPMNENELAQHIATTLRSREGTGPAWDVEILDCGLGYATIRVKVTKKMLNGHGTMHGGMIFAVADTAFGYVCNGRNVKAVAAQASIVFLSAVEEGEILIAECREEALAGRSGVYHVKVRTEEGRPVAEFQGYSRTLRESSI